MPADVDVRDCQLYRFWVRHPVTGEIVLGYVGETVRQPFERLMEHVYSQPWIDTVVRWEVDPRAFAGKQAVLEAESQAIRSELPLYNVKENLANPARIIPPEAIRQRRARDLERRRPRWVHPDDRNRPDQSTPIMPDRPVSVPRTWTALQVKALVLSCTWVLTAAAITGFLGQYGLLSSWSQRMLAGLACAPILIVWSLAGAPVTGRQWKALRRRLRRRVDRWWTGAPTRRSRRR
jgi:hypothetical protein